MVLLVKKKTKRQGREEKAERERAFKKLTKRALPQ
jgi:hypothetical protein